MAPKQPPRRPPVVPTHDATTSSDGSIAYRSPISISPFPIDETLNDVALPDSTSSDVPQEDNLQEMVYGDEPQALGGINEIKPLRIFKGR